MGSKAVLATGCLLWSLMVCVPAHAQIPELSGVSDFLCGIWKSEVTQKDSKGEMTYLILHNPTAVTRDAVVLYYGEDQKFLYCHVVRLTPHDFEKLPLIFPDGPYDGSKKGMVQQGQGVLEVRSAPVVKENPNNPGGLIGYVQVVEGYSLYDFGAAVPPDSWQASGLTLGLSPLFPVDVELFTTSSPIQGQLSKIVDCVCDKLKALNSPKELQDIFCIRIY